jgi:hypothetical protein
MSKTPHGIQCRGRTVAPGTDCSNGRDAAALKCSPAAGIDATLKKGDFRHVPLATQRSDYIVYSRAQDVSPPSYHRKDLDFRTRRHRIEQPVGEADGALPTSWLNRASSRGAALGRRTGHPTLPPALVQKLNGARAWR